MASIPPEQLGSFGACVSSPPAGDTFLTAKQVRQRYGDASDMWLWRRLHDDSGFPRPLEICGRRFWKLAELAGWEGERARARTEA